MRDVTEQLLFFSEFLTNSFDSVHNYLQNKYDDVYELSVQLDIYKQSGKY